MERRRSISSPIVLCARTTDIKRFEKKEDCFILNFDPCEPIEISDDENAGENTADDIEIVAEKGQIASRHYPHARHLCPQFPFETTERGKHCKKCYCYICDLAAPCNEWTRHCEATDQGIQGRMWKFEREINQQVKKAMSETRVSIQSSPGDAEAISVQWSG